MIEPEPLLTTTMDFSALLLTTIAVAFLAITLRAKQMCIRRRDVAILSALAGLSGLGSVAVLMS